MKLVFTIGAIASCLQGSAAIDRAAPDAMTQLQTIMGDSQRSLARAQRRQEKVVKKMKTQLAQEFVTDAQKVGASIGAYARELAEARSELTQTVNLAKKELAHIVVPTNDWQSPIISEKAQISALVGAAEHDMNHAERRDSRAVREATEKVAEGIEEEGEALSMKLGDLSSETKQAKQTLSDAVDKAQDSKNSSAMKNSTNSSNLTALSQMLQVAMKKAKADASKADSKMEAILSQAKIDADAHEKKSEQELTEAEHKVIEKVLGHGPDKTHLQPRTLRGPKAASPPPATKNWDKKAPINLHPKAKAAVDPSKAVHVGQGGHKYQAQH